MSNDLRERLKDIIRELEDILDETENLTENDGTGEADQPLISRKLAIVVGHTRLRPGAIAAAPINAQEYFWNTDLAKQMRDHAESTGVPLQIFYRDSVGITGAYRQAAGFGASAVMELHFNSYESPRATGTETLWATAPSETFAKAVQQAMVQTLGLRDRGDKYLTSGRGFKSLTQLPDTPSILVEPFFGSNPNNCSIAHDHKNKLAKALVEASRTFLVG